MAIIIITVCSGLMGTALLSRMSARPDWLQFKQQEATPNECSAQISDMENMPAMRECMLGSVQGAEETAPRSCQQLELASALPESGALGHKR